ncbi:methyltransferase [Aeromicrobium ginsengisoli]|uniref:Class I SAM-dependent methyltransferase n=1 Tax=Aeromicrobium ginsengisoli TaxID=363867 RepID=A0A5M4FC95_9ACTN|nr:class I SAM-dependent methyltransferase [Aeromicrobium ginsengisoli]KAA1395839.1 class I SAM-dependent methyltransferase [Aeromicrobium ginsengisoli]
MTLDVEPVRTELIEFGSLSIQYDQRVLRPRRWTTAQSAWASALLRTAPAGPVLELCAGVGHIGLLTMVGQDRPLVLVDSSEVACDHAAANVERANLPGPVDIRCGLMDGLIADEERFALIIADPPWVPSADTGEHVDDPVHAIDGGADGLDLARTCLELIGRHLGDGGSALLQLGGLDQVAAVSDHLTDHPELDLRLVEHRAYDDRGVLVLLVR